MNTVELMYEIKKMPLMVFLANGLGNKEQWKLLRKARTGRIVIRVIEGGNEFMKPGQSLSGKTPGIVVGFPVAIEYPNGWYSSTAVEKINWAEDGESGTFKTLKSSYSFHFCKY